MSAQDQACEAALDAGLEAHEQEGQGGGLASQKPWELGHQVLTVTEESFIHLC